MRKTGLWIEWEIDGPRFVGRVRGRVARASASAIDPLESVVPAMYTGCTCNRPFVGSPLPLGRARLARFPGSALVTTCVPRAYDARTRAIKADSRAPRRKCARAPRRAWISRTDTNRPRRESRSGLRSPLTSTWINGVSALMKGDSMMEFTW